MIANRHAMSDKFQTIARLNDEARANHIRQLLAISRSAALIDEAEAIKASIDPHLPDSNKATITACLHSDCVAVWLGVFWEPEATVRRAIEAAGLEIGEPEDSDNFRHLHLRGLDVYICCHRDKAEVIQMPEPLPCAA